VNRNLKKAQALIREFQSQTPKIQSALSADRAASLIQDLDERKQKESPQGSHTPEPPQAHDLGHHRRFLCGPKRKSLARVFARNTQQSSGSRDDPQ
jgi:hypothetical protein